jgi:hypothetical protein
MMTMGQLVSEIGRHQPAELALLLGAGASKSSGVSLAWEMIDEWRQDLFEANVADGAYSEEVVFKAASPSRAGTPPTAIQPNVLSASVGQSIMPSAPPSGFPALGQQTQSTTEEDEAASSSH